MKSEKRNSVIDEVEQNVVVALYDSYVCGFSEWQTKISFGEYIGAVRLGIEHPELAEVLADDRKRRYGKGE